MTLTGWLATRIPEPPPALAARVHLALGGHGLADSADMAAVLVDAANDRLRELLHRESSGRDSALDLLTVDALMTYAFEAASAAPGSLPDLAADAMRRLATAARI